MIIFGLIIGLCLIWNSYDKYAFKPSKYVPKKHALNLERKPLKIKRIKSSPYVYTSNTDKVEPPVLLFLANETTAIDHELLFRSHIDLGKNVFTMDYPGSGPNYCGKYIAKPRQVVKDACTFAEFIFKKHGAFHLVGRSVGGAISLQVELYLLQKYPDQKIILSRTLVGSFADCIKVGCDRAESHIQPLKKLKKKLPPEAYEKLKRSIVSFLISKQLSICEKKAEKIITPTLIFHATRDTHINIEHGKELARLLPNSEFIPVDSDEHIKIVYKGKSLNKMVEHMTKHEVR